MYFQYRKLYKFIYYFLNLTHSYTFWVKKIPHWYTFEVKIIPIYILGCLKIQPHVCIYLPPPPPPPQWLPTPPQGSGVVGIPGIIYLAPPPPPRPTREIQREWTWQYEGICTYNVFCLTPRSTFSRVWSPSPGARYIPWTLWTQQTNFDVIGLRPVAFVPVSMYLKWYTFIKTER